MWKGKKSHGIVKDDGEINFANLERQIDVAVNADSKYWIQNDAKIRAVNNKVASYEEFVDIVKASHLKPLEKGDRISEIKVFKQPWNVSSRTDDSSGSSRKPSDLQCQTICNINQFNRHWKRQCKSSEEQSDFLLSMENNTILEIFRAEIGLGLLGDMIVILQKHYTCDKSESIANLLYTLTNCGRFDLSLTFLSSKEKIDLESLLEQLSVDWNSENTGQLKELYLK